MARQDDQMRQLRATNLALVGQLTGLNWQVATLQAEVTALKTGQQQPVSLPPISVRKRGAPAPRPNESGASVETQQRPPPKKRMKLSIGAETSVSGAAAESVPHPPPRKRKTTLCDFILGELKALQPELDQRNAMRQATGTYIMTTVEHLSQASNTHVF